MPADLDPVAGVAVVVGRVDDPGREPEHALLDLEQDLFVDVVLDFAGLGH